MKLKIRKYHPTDIKSLYKISLQTSNRGKDVEFLRDEPNLIGDLFIAPYVRFEPELCFVLTMDDVPCGYIVGTKNTEDFYLQCEKEYFLNIRKKYKYLPNGKNPRYDVLKRVIKNGHKPKDKFDLYPAHLHINILPSAKGKGMGRKLIDKLFNKLITMNISGMHLEVGKTNKNAIQFYAHLGFRVIKDYEYSMIMGIDLSS